MGDVIRLNKVRGDFSKNALTLEQGLKMLGLEKWPGHWEHWKENIFLNGLTSIIIREGESWVRFNRESILRELDRILSVKRDE